MNARRPILSVLAVVLGVLVCGSASALAAAPPMLGETSVLEVNGDSATLQAEINPEGSETAYRFEYGPSEAYGQSAPLPEGVVVGTALEAVEVHIEGLAPGTTYHYRVVAESVGGTVRGVDETFTTQHAGGVFALPDGRQWEMVSPPDKHGARITAPAFVIGGLDQAAASGGAMTYTSDNPTELESGGFLGVAQALSTRGPGGWQTRDLAVPHAEGAGVSQSVSDYSAFSSDLSLAAIQPAGPFVPCVDAEGASQPCLSPEASEPTAFLGTDFFNGNVEEPCLPKGDTYCARPLVSDCPAKGSCPRVVEEHADVPPGTVFGGRYGGEVYLRPYCIGGGAFSAYACGPNFAAGTPDLSHILVTAEASLTPGAPAAGEDEPYDLYEWSAGKLTFAGRGDPEWANRYQASSPDLLSDNGSRLVVRANSGSPGSPLIMIDTVTGEIVTLDIVQGGSGEGRAEPAFQGMSSDGSKVFFTDEQRLTANADGSNLYECEMVEEGGKLACRLSDLTPPPRSGEEANVLHGILGVSEDGSWVYFASEASLAAGAPSGQPNLYVYHDGVTKLIATLSQADASDWAGGAGELTEESSRVSPNGEWLAFMSQARLIGYDNRDAVSGEPDAEVYLYDARTDSLACASCNPTGARPTGTEYDSLELARDGLWPENGWVAATVPGWQRGSGNHPIGQTAYQSRYLDDSGRLFFDSEDALVPKDVDGAVDVYEYEPEGVGSCTSSSFSGGVVFRAARAFSVEGRAGEEGAGCVGLITSGNSGQESVFMDASENGGDVFFLTDAQLAPQDHDSAADVYDAHECSAQSPCENVPTSPPPCDNESSCKPAPSPQPAIYGLPSSATFSGPGDLVPGAPFAPKVVSTKTVKCGKRFVKKKGRCVRLKAKRGRARRVRASRERRGR